MTPSLPNRAVPTAPSLADPALAAQRASTLTDAAAMYGRQSTILTRAASQAAAAPQRKVLLGGS